MLSTPYSLYISPIHDALPISLNQLLVEMDGFDVKTNVILIAATNRPDVLDPALLRPGRFDRQIPVEAPDMKGRRHILEVHAADKPLADEVDLSQIAKRTPGFSGADLANVLNEAALLTARENAKVIDNRILDEAIDRVIAGPQKRTRLMNDKIGRASWRERVWSLGVEGWVKQNTIAAGGGQ